MQNRRLWRSVFRGHYPPRKREFPAAAVRRAVFQPQGDKPMQWTTPTATDFRFGFEITMYVSAR